MSKKKIALVAASPMSINAFLIPQIKAFSEKYDVTVITNMKNTIFNLDSITDRVRVIHCPISRNIHPLKDLHALACLIRIFQREKFSLVHSFTPKAGLLAAVSAKIASIKCRLHTFTGQVWATEKGLKRQLLKSIDKITARLDTGIIVDSFSQREFLIKNKVLGNDSKSRVFCDGSISGVDINRFKPQQNKRKALRKELGIEGRATVFLFIGRLKKDKGILDLAHAFERISSPRAVLVIVGSDEEGLTPTLQTVLKDKKNAFHILQHTDKPEELMAMADVLCIPSYREGFGTVVIEAAACGIPAIGSNIYGLSDAIKDNETGFLFPVKDTNKLCSLMGHFVEDDPFRREMGQRARQNAQKKFPHEKIVQAWSDLYETLI